MSNLISSSSIDLCYERKSGIMREREGGTQTAAVEIRNCLSS